jgi:cytochrome P450
VSAAPGSAAPPVSELDPFSDAFLNDPYPAHQELRESGPAVWLPAYDVWALARHEYVVAALKNPATFCSSAGVGLANLRKEEPWRPPSLLLEADPPEHKRARRVVTRVLTPTVVRQLKAEFLAYARRLVDDLTTQGSFDAIAELSEAFVLRVFPDLIGLPTEGRHNLLTYGAMVFNGFGPRNRHFENAMARAGEVSAWIGVHCYPDALTPGSLGAQIHEVAAAEGYSVDDAARILRSFLSAGVDTTVHAIGNAVLCLAQHPRQWQRLRADSSLARATLEEVLRFESPAQTFFRTTTRVVDIDGVTIPAGDKVLLFVGAANRDHRRWDEADGFDICRNTVGHLGFGAGIHACVGQLLARLEGEVVLTALAERIDTIQINGKVVRMLSNAVRGLEALPVAVTSAE